MIVNEKNHRKTQNIKWLAITYMLLLSFTISFQPGVVEQGGDASGILTVGERENGLKIEIKTFLIATAIS